MESIIINTGTTICRCIEIFMTTFFFSTLLTPKYSRTRCHIRGCIIIVFCAILSAVISANMYVSQIIHFGGYYIAGRTLHKDSRERIIFSIILLFLLIVLCDMTAAICIFALFPKISNALEGKGLFIGSIFFCVLFLISSQLILIFQKFQKQDLFSKSILFTLLAPLSQLLLLDGLVYYNYNTFQSLTSENTLRTTAICMFAGILLSFLSEFLLLQVTLENSKKEHLAAQLEILQHQHNMELSYYMAVNERIQEIRKIRHDFNNQLQTAYQLFLHENNREEATLLLQDLEAHIEEISPVYYCSNLIVNAILWEKSRIAEKEGITLNINVEMPESISIQKIDICSVFSNLLDNAINAAKMCTDEKEISVRSYIKNGYCVIKTANTFCPSFSGRKDFGKDETLHGYGLIILNSLAEKYQGEFKTKKQQNRFHAVIKLRCDN